MNFKKINQAVALQKKANYQIETFGQTTEDVANELELLSDSFTQEEADEFIAILLSTAQEDDFALYVQSEIDFIRNK
jgi:hypothetical protein